MSAIVFIALSLLPPSLPQFLPSSLPSSLPLSHSLLVQLSHHTLRGDYYHSSPEEAFESAVHSVNRPSDLRIVWLEYLSYLRGKAVSNKGNHSAFKVPASLCMSRKVLSRVIFPIRHFQTVCTGVWLSWIPKRPHPL